jgi:hypothetical protein
MTAAQLPTQEAKLNSNFKQFDQQGSDPCTKSESDPI